MKLSEIGMTVSLKTICSVYYASDEFSADIGCYSSKTDYTDPRRMIGQDNEVLKISPTGEDTLEVWALKTGGGGNV